MPIRVLHIIDSLGMGGAETWLMELLRYWSKTGAVQMQFLATSGNRGVFDDEVLALGGRIHYLRYGRAHLASFTAAYNRLLRQECYDAIHDHADYASGWHYLLGLGVLPRVRVTHVHNPSLHLRANYVISPSRRAVARTGKALTLRLATHVCGTSSKALTEYGFKIGGRDPAVSVLHCGFDVGAFIRPRAADRRSVLNEFGFHDDAKIVLFAGRLDRDFELDHPRNHKNSWLAALVARAAAQTNAEIRLLMAGAGHEQRAELERRIAGWHLSDKLRVIGIRRDISRLMRAADVLLFPSAEEGLGMVAVEAQAAGLPVVASAAVPNEAVVIPELFTMVRTNLSLQCWVEALLAAINRPRPRPEVCREAMETSDFSIVNSARRLEAIYHGT